MLLISDSTLRDGNHAVSHGLTGEQITAYVQQADSAGLAFIEVGHGNGLGASSFQVGKSQLSDQQMLSTAKKCLKKTKLSVHVIPGFATVVKDLQPAIEMGVDAFRIGTHCSEADTAEAHIRFLKGQSCEVYGVLMMSHMIGKEDLTKSALLMESYGVEGVIIMDSAGAYLMNDVRERIEHLVAHLKVRVGFHAHNNLGLAVANTVVAVEAGATIIDATARGFGAGAGNCQLEAIIPVLHKLGHETGVDLYALLDAAETAERMLIQELPSSKTMSITTGLAGVFSGFAKHIQRIAKRVNIDPKDIVFELGRRRVVAGQEDMILEVVKQMQNAQK